VRYYSGASVVGDRERGLGDTLTAEFHGLRSLERGHVCRIVYHGRRSAVGQCQKIEVMAMWWVTHQLLARVSFGTPYSGRPTSTTAHKVVVRANSAMCSAKDVPTNSRRVPTMFHVKHSGVPLLHLVLVRRLCCDKR